MMSMLRGTIVYQDMKDLFKVHPLLDLIILHFSAVNGQHKELSLYEMPIAFKGRYKRMATQHLIE